VSRLVLGERVAFRCDGNDRIGAGHVARCLPLAMALARLGWTASFVGAYGGLAAWLLARAEADARAAEPNAPCGIPIEHYDATIVDSYAIAPASICELACELPVVTLAEANRCPVRGILLDYHLDRTEPSNSRLLAGPSFAPLDPAFAGAGRAGNEVRKVLVTVGGSHRGRALLSQVASVASSSFPDADILLAVGAQSETNGPGVPRAIELPMPSSLVDALPEIDLAITAAGLTAYELACAGVPQVAIALTTNQRRVVDGLRSRNLAPCLDLTSGDSLADLSPALRRLSDRGLRRHLSEQGMRAFDGHGARRAAIALTELFGGAGGGKGYRTPPTDR
jgi:UDP-2,4-diacetamido-2,4,6-trideoxy-beta-L-altropyranose hydrolase